MNKTPSQDVYNLPKSIIHTPGPNGPEEKKKHQYSNQENPIMHKPSKRYENLFRTSLPLSSIPSRLRSRRNTASLSSFMGLKAQSLPSRSPSLLVLTQSLSLLLVGSTKLVIGFLARVALGVLLILLLLLPELSLLPALVLEAIGNMSVQCFSSMNRLM